MNFYDFIKGRRSPQKEGVACDVDIEKHNKRYHPNGVSEHTHCKYRVTPKEAKVALERDFGVKPLFVSSIDELQKAKFGLLDSYVLQNSGVLLGEKVFNDNLVRVYNVLKDLKERFPTFKLDAPYLLAFDFCKIGGLAASSLDRRWKPEEQKIHAQLTEKVRESIRPECYLAIGDLTNPPKSKVCFGRHDERYAADIIRHEIGHNLATQEIINYYQTIRAGAIAERGAREVFLSLRHSVSPIAAENVEEAVAEIFSLGTSDEAERLSLGLRKLVARMLGVDVPEDKREGVAMDSRERVSEQEKSHSRPWRIFSIVCPLNLPPEGKISWWDSERCAYVEFDTHADLLEYVFAWFGLDKDEALHLERKFPNKKWGEYGIAQDLAEFRVWSNKSLGEIIEMVKQWEAADKRAQTNPQSHKVSPFQG